MRPQLTTEQHVHNLQGGTSQALAVTTTAVQSTVIAAEGTGVPVHVIATATAPVFIRTGANPTAVNTGVDHYIPANWPIRLEMRGGDRLSAITLTGTATLYLTPDL